MIRSLSAAFAKAGYRLTNPRNQWSAAHDDGSAVALTVWTDEIDKSQEPWVLDTRGHPRLTVWINKAGNAMRKTHIAHALAHCGGQVDLILCKAVDPAANPRKIDWARPWPERTGQLQAGSFDPATGVFRLELRPAGAPY